jgi:hypothetical protein
MVEFRYRLCGISARWFSRHPRSHPICRGFLCRSLARSPVRSVRSRGGGHTRSSTESVLGLAIAGASSSPGLSDPTAVGRIEGDVRIHELTLATGDVAGQLMFWGETLGLPVRDSRDGAIEVSLQASTLRFEQASPGADPRYHFAINVPRARSRRLRPGVRSDTSCSPFTAIPTRRRVRRLRIPIAGPRRSTSSMPPATLSSRSRTMTSTTAPISRSVPIRFSRSRRSGSGPRIRRRRVLRSRRRSRRRSFGVGARDGC